MNLKIKWIKNQLACALNDELHKKKWHKYIDYAILSMIILSTIEVFLSTYDDIAAKYPHILHFIDIFTTIIFTIEVTIRIWVADELSDKYKGFIGRIKYCCSFYGIIDILSTYPFYINLITQIPYTAFKILRVARILRVFRYMNSFKLLSQAFKSKKDELMVSLQFLCIITIILSFILFFVEHDIQPEAYKNGMDSVIWAFAQYIGDPGGFAENPPVSLIGRIIACIIGILGIAIFAVPAGLIGTGFMEAIEDKQKEEHTKENIEKLHLAFERKMCRFTHFQIVPKFVTMADIQARLRMTLDDVFDAVNNSNDFRLVNMATTRTIDEKAEDQLAVENFQINTVYGCCIDRGSKVTIVSPSSNVDPIIGHFAYYLAKIGRFNYVSRELGATRPYKSFFLVKPDNIAPNSQEFMKDLNMLTKNGSNWIITLLASSGANEPNYPTQIHYSYGGEKGDTTYNDKNITIHDIDIFDKFLNSMTKILKHSYDLESDKQEYYSSSNPQIYTRHLDNSDKINSFIIRAAWSTTCWDPRSIQIAQTMANTINQYLNGNKELQESPELKIKDIGFSDYKD